MYSAYAFWRQESSSSKNTGNVKQHNAIHINNRHTVVITEHNLKAFLEEGKRAEMEKMIEEKGLTDRVEIIKGSRSSRYSRRSSDRESLKSALSIASTSDTSASDTLGFMETLEEAKQELADIATILKSYQNLNLAKIIQVLNNFNDLYEKWGQALDEDIAQLNLFGCLRDVVLHEFTIMSGSAANFDSSHTYVIDNILGIFSNTTDASRFLCKCVIDSGLIKLSVEALINAMCLKIFNEENETDEKNETLYKIVVDLFEGALGTLHNCIRLVPGEPIYEQENVKEVAKNFLSCKVDVLRVLATMIVTALINEDENQKMEHAGAIPYMVNALKQSLSSSFGRFEGFSILEVLECLVRISANDANKMKVIEAGILPCLVTLMKSQDGEEVTMSAKLLWLLCFDDTAKQKVIEEPECLENLKSLLKSENSRIKHMASGALWKIRGEQQYHEKHGEVTQQSQNDLKHIFISYQWDNQETMLQVKERLKKDGFKVWIDVDQMGGSTLESMAEAVENALVVLVCASEKYKISPNCRTEAEYTFQLKKPIIPLMLQRYYKPDGWLGMLLGAKMYINFDGKYTFDKAYEMLRRELQKKYSSSHSMTVDPMLDVIDGSEAPVVQAALPRSQYVQSEWEVQAAKWDIQQSEWEVQAAKWDRQQVMDWVKTNHLAKLSSGLKTLFQEMDGELLVHLLKLKKEAPEFFYRELKTQYDVDLLSVVKLNKAFDLILKQQQLK